MIDPGEVQAAVLRWQTTAPQIRRDHLISHVLHGLKGAPGFVFFGGTALNRTFVEQGRLSEDVDLYLAPTAPADPESILDGLRRATRREFPHLEIGVVRTRSDVRTYPIRVEDLRIQIQFVGPRSDLGRLGFSMKEVALRYSDLPATVVLPVPDLDAFVATKLTAFEDHGASRDLFDLGSLAALGAIVPSSIEVLRSFRGSGPARWAYREDRTPDMTVWEAELAHQTGTPGDPGATLALVRESLEASGAWEPE